MDTSEEFVSEVWNDGHLRIVRVGFWLQLINMDTNDRKWKWQGRPQRVVDQFFHKIPTVDWSTNSNE